MSVGFVLPG